MHLSSTMNLRELYERPFVRNNVGSVRSAPELDDALAHCAALPDSIPYDTRSSYMRSIRAEAVTLRAHAVLQRAYMASARMAARAQHVEEAQLCALKVLMPDETLLALDGDVLAEMLELAVLGCALLDDGHQFCATLASYVGVKCDAIGAAARFMAGDYVFCMRNFRGCTPLAVLLQERARLEWEKLRLRVVR